jgi:hypothetical protein
MNIVEKEVVYLVCFQNGGFIIWKTLTDAQTSKLRAEKDGMACVIKPYFIHTHE